MATLLLIAALVVPVATFWGLRSRLRWSGLRAAGVAIVAGWALGVAWAAVGGEAVALAAAFGWVCPSLLVALTALVWRFVGK